MQIKHSLCVIYGIRATYVYINTHGIMTYTGKIDIHILVLCTH